MNRFRMSPKAPRHMLGQSMVEFLIAAPVVLFLILAVVQFVLFYRIKATLDYAALQAARAGAVSGVDKGKMKEGLAVGMTPLFAHGKSLGELELAYGRARLDMLLYSKIEVISPTRAAWNDHKERQYNGKQALPNDSLSFRSDVVKSSGVSVQDANILKIKVTYQAPLVVPFVGWVLRGRSDYLKAGTFETSPINRLTGRLPIESHAIVRMQSPIFDRNNLDK